MFFSVPLLEATSLHHLPIARHAEHGSRIGVWHFEFLEATYGSNDNACTIGFWQQVSCAKCAPLTRLLLQLSGRSVICG